MVKVVNQTVRWSPLQKRCAQIDLMYVFFNPISIFRTQTQQKIQRLETELERCQAKLVAMERQHSSQVETTFFYSNSHHCMFGVEQSILFLNTVWCDTFMWIKAKIFYQLLAVEQENRYPGVEGGKHLLSKEKFLGTGEVFTVCSWIRNMNRDFRSLYSLFSFSY